MPVATMRQLLEAGIHFGHQTRRWNPKMNRFIFGQRNGIYIIDLQKTLRQIHKAHALVRDTASGGGAVLFVGTKKQAQEPIAREAQRCGMYYVNSRWLGGTLTNFQTVQRSVRRLLDLEEQEESGRFDTLSKKEAARLRKEMARLEKSLCGIKTMGRLPDLVFVIDTRKEAIAVREAARLNIPCVGIVDTNADPDAVPIPIPGNDDAIRAVNLFCSVVANAVLEGVAQGQKAGGVQAEQPPEAAAVADAPEQPEPEPPEDRESTEAAPQVEAEAGASPDADLEHVQE